MSIIGKQYECFVYESVIAYSHRALIEARLCPCGDDFTKILVDLQAVLALLLSEGGSEKVRDSILPEWHDWYCLLNKYRSLPVERLKRFDMAAPVLIGVIRLALKACESETENLEFARSCIDAVHALPTAIISDNWNACDYWDVYLKELDASGGGFLAGESIFSPRRSD